MRPLLAVRNVRCTIHCCVPTATDELEGVKPDPPTGKLSLLCAYLRKKFRARGAAKHDFEPAGIG